MPTVKCDQCCALAINGHPSHEQGCPNRRYQWRVIGDECLPFKEVDEISDDDLEAAAEFYDRLA